MDRGRINCYRAEWSLGPQAQLGWSDLQALAHRVMRDPVIREAYPALRARPLRLRSLNRCATYLGQYEPACHRVTLAYEGRSALVLLHELAHAATPFDAHGSRWREAYCLLAYRMLDLDTAQRLTAAFRNHRAL